VDLEDWNGRSIRVAKSRGGVLAVEDFSDNLLRAPGCWPAPEILQKLYQSRQQGAFDGPEHERVTRRLGYYCDLQSLHSEDAITWSFFGLLVGAEGRTRVHFLNWLLRSVGRPAQECECDIALWRRIPHPDKPVSGGPEIDFLLVGNETVVLGEAKWGATEGTGQGVEHNKGQLQLRQEFGEVLGAQIFPDRRFLVAVVTLDGHSDVRNAGDRVPIASTTWEHLAGFDRHPSNSEFRRYYHWKLSHFRRPGRQPQPVTGLVSPVL
jgi:hypothetical protein